MTLRWSRLCLLGTACLSAQAPERPSIRVTVAAPACLPDEIWLFSAVPLTGAPREAPEPLEFACGQPFLVRDLAPGNYRFALWDNFQTHWALKEVSVGRENPAVTMTLMPAAQVSGRIILLDGVPLPPNLRVDTLPMLSGLPLLRHRLILDAEGRFTLTKVLWPSQRLDIWIPVHYYIREVRLNGSKLEGNTLALPVPAQDRTESSLEIFIGPATGTLTGTVLENGRPLSGVLLALLHVTPQAFMVWGPTGRPTDGEGRFRLLGITPGEYRVTPARRDPASGSLEPIPEAAVTVRLGPGESRDLMIEIP